MRSCTFPRCRPSTVMILILVCAGFSNAHAQVVRDAAPDLGQETDPRSLAERLPTSGWPLDDLVSLGLERNPQLAKANLAVDAARGRAIQAGLYPNPSLAITFDELGDRTGRSGVNTLPLISQEFVSGGKLRLSQAAALREVGQTQWTAVARRFELLAEIRSAYFEALALQTRIAVLEDLVQIADKSVMQTGDLLEAKQAARLDLIQLEVESERLRAEFESAERELPSVYQRLAATIGVRDADIGRVAGSLELPLPEYDLAGVREATLAGHPELRAAQMDVERARLLIRRAEVEPLPNLNVDAGYVRQNQNQSDDMRFGASISVPLWNRNQGNLRAARAQLRIALQEVQGVGNDLTARGAQAMRDYASASRRAAKYRTAIIPRTEESYRLSFDAYQGGQFEYLRVLEAQRAMAQANLEYLRALGDAWQAAAVLSGLTREEQWPPAR